MTDYDFNIIEVVNHSTNSTNGYYWEEVKVDNGWINGKCIFCNTIGTGSKMRYKITYTNKDKGIIDEKNTFAKWYLDELKKSRGEDDDSSTSETTSESTTSESGSCCENLYRFIVQVVFTIIPILPIWWIFKFLLMKFNYKFFLFVKKGTQIKGII